MVGVPVGACEAETVDVTAALVEGPLEDVLVSEAVLEAVASAVEAAELVSVPLMLAAGRLAVVVAVLVAAGVVLPVLVVVNVAVGAVVTDDEPVAETVAAAEAPRLCVAERVTGPDSVAVRDALFVLELLRVGVGVIEGLPAALVPVLLVVGDTLVVPEAGRWLTDRLAVAAAVGVVAADAVPEGVAGKDPAGGGLPLAEGVGLATHKAWAPQKASEAMTRLYWRQVPPREVVGGLPNCNDLE
jgi:hypothetical protein